MMVARKLCRKRKTTSTTRTTASKKVWTTSSMDAWTNCGGIQDHLVVQPVGEASSAPPAVARTVLGDLDGIGPGLLVDGDQRRRACPGTVVRME